MRLRVGAILVAILALAAAPTFAQVTGAVKVGVNFSQAKNVVDDVEFETDWKTGLVIGGGIDVPITTLFSFSPEVLYTQKGGKNGDLIDDVGDIDVKLNIDQIQIPLLFKAKFNSGDVTPFVSFGPGIGFTTSAKIKVEDIDDDEDIKDDVETVDFSGIIGGGVQFGRGIIEVRWDQGFRDLDKEDFSELKLRTFSILFGYSFP